MSKSSDLVKRIWDLFIKPSPPQRKAYHEYVKSSEDNNLINHFSQFDPLHIEKAKAYIEKWNGMASDRSRPDDQLLHSVLDDFVALQGKENPDLLYFSLEVFLTHFKSSIAFGIPSILVREPEQIVPSRYTEAKPNAEIAVGSVVESKLDWFREDPLLNEHHAHWHVVYFTRNVYDRQGEMFFYMHQQMLARYDAERIEVENAGRVKPFNDFSQPIKVGYAFGPDERLDDVFGMDREPNGKVTQQNANIQKQLRQLILDAVQSGQFDLDASIQDPLLRETSAINSLGSTLEPNIHPDGRRDVSYQGYHGMGHMFIGGINEGVMFDTQSAIRDVIFWEWHKEVDSHYILLQERFEPYDFNADAPPVIMRTGADDDGEPNAVDIILCFSKDIPGFAEPGFDGTAVGTAAFGGNQWNKEFSSGSYTFRDHNDSEHTIQTTNTLRTTFQYGRITYSRNGQQKEYDYNYLNHEAFSYFIRIQNTSLIQKQVTIRIFIAPEAFVNDRTMWIEMDKFSYELMPDSKSVIFRRDTESSVIRKPAVKDPSTNNTRFDPTEIEIDAAQCKCGWPYHLLIPKGAATETGSKYKLVVMVSDAEIDLTRDEPDCGSLSFCGRRDAEFPDKRPLGYPFNRKFSGNGSTIINRVTSLPNFSCRSFHIQHVL